MEDKLYAGKNLFSQCNSIWAKYEVKKPRLPTINEVEKKAKRWVDDADSRPSAFSMYIGLHNIDLSRALLRISQEFADTNALPKVVLIYGARGKARIVQAQVHDNSIAINGISEIVLYCGDNFQYFL
jgi:hypothetical protein